MSLELAITLRGIDEMQEELERIAKRAVPFAARDALNGLAFAGRKIWQEQIASSLTLRNRFTERRALVERVATYRMADMEATLGHTEEYMRRLELGIGERARRSGIAIPTEHASGQAKGSLPGGRKRMVKKAFVTRALGKIRRQPKSLNRKARNARAVARAIKDGSRLAYLELPKKRGLYRILGGRKAPQIRKLYDLTRRSTPRPRVPTLQTTIEKTVPLGPGLAFAALSRQLERGRGSGR